MKRMISIGIILVLFGLFLSGCQQQKEVAVSGTPSIEEAELNIDQQELDELDQMETELNDVNLDDVENLEIK